MHGCNVEFIQENIRTQCQKLQRATKNKVTYVQLNDGDQQYPPPTSESQKSVASPKNFMLVFDQVQQQVDQLNPHIRYDTHDDAALQTRCRVQKVHFLRVVFGEL